MNESDIKTLVREHYAAAAQSVTDEDACCGGSCGAGDGISDNLYTSEEVDGLPERAVTASLGCGNPTALAELREGEVVLDLGSGGGIDVLLSAKRVGPTGRAYGLDMTDEMLALARENQRAAGVTNVEFLRGEIENIPLPEASVDVVISNCVVNLSPDKDRVLREAFRVLRPGGRFAISDVVVQGTMPASVRTDAEAWAGCVAGALEETEYRDKLRAAGFADVDVEVTRVYDAADLSGGCCGAEADGPATDGALVSAFIRARKPVIAA